MIANASANVAAQRYELVTREGKSRFALRLKDEGVILGDEGILEWTANGVARSRPLADVASVNLQVANPGVSICQIEFRDGSTLRVMNIDRWGLSTPKRSSTYSAFVHELHARLAACADQRMSFLAGNSGNAAGWRKAAMLVGALFFIGGPALMLAVSGDREAWWYLLLGTGIFFPAWYTYRGNKPRTYSPDRIPADMLR